MLVLLNEVCKLKYPFTAYGYGVEGDLVSRWLVSGPAQCHHEPPTATAEVKRGGHRSAFSAVLCREPHEHDLVCAVVDPRPLLVETLTPRATGKGVGGI